MNIDAERLTQHFQEMGTDDLIRILHIDTDEYLPEGKEFAVRELKKRGIDAYAASTVDDANKLRSKIIEERNQKQIEDASEPLPHNLKLLYTFLPGIALWADMFTPKERTRRKKDIARCWIKGLLLWTVLILVAPILLSVIFKR